VRIRIEPLAIEAERLQLSCTISDTGIGIDANNRQRLFQAFSQIDNSSSRRFGGTGLGLVICQRLVQMMGGDIEVESEFGSGSAFRFHLWLRRNPESTMHRDIEVVSLQGKRLLAIDDDDDYLCILREQAAALGMSVDTVRLPAQALAAARIAPPDIITIDLDMPDIDGFALDQAFNDSAELATIPRILLTASCAPPGTRALHQSGFDAAYSKPTSAQQLRAILTTTLAGNRQRGATAPHSMQNSIHNYSTLSVLVAEDNAVNRQVINGMLQRFGIHADFASDGEQALALAEQQPYDLILMDCEMPVLDGYRASQRIRQFERVAGRNAAIIIALSAHALPEYRERSLAAGMNEHLTKPIGLVVLDETLQRYAPPQ
jgi:CheY-like chemotaxis protein